MLVIYIHRIYTVNLLFTCLLSSSCSTSSGVRPWIRARFHQRLKLCSPETSRKCLQAVATRRPRTARTTTSVAAMGRVRRFSSSFSCSSPAFHHSHRTHETFKPPENKPPSSQHGGSPPRTVHVVTLTASRGGQKLLAAGQIRHLHTEAAESCLWS